MRFGINANILGLVSAVLTFSFSRQILSYPFILLYFYACLQLENVRISFVGRGIKTSKNISKMHKTQIESRVIRFDDLTFAVVLLA